MEEALNDRLADIFNMIGCGVCVYHCPVEAITLIARPDFVEPPTSFKDLMARQAEAKLKVASQ